MKGVFKEGTKYILRIIKPYKNELSALVLESLCKENGTESGVYFHRFGIPSQPLKNYMTFY